MGACTDLEGVERRSGGRDPGASTLGGLTSPILGITVTALSETAPGQTCYPRGGHRSTDTQREGFRGDGAAESPAGGRALTLVRELLAGAGNLSNF